MRRQIENNRHTKIVHDPQEIIKMEAIKCKQIRKN